MTQGNGTQAVLAVHDEDDLAMVSARFQDAAVRMADIAYLPTERRFVLVASRFMHERVRKGFFSRLSRGWRTKAGLHFDTVLKVERRGLPDADNVDSVLPLLAITLEPRSQPDTGRDPGQAEEGVGPEEGQAAVVDPVIVLTFGGGAQIRIHAECLEAEARDMGAPWPASRRPSHA